MVVGASEHVVFAFCFVECSESKYPLMVESCGSVNEKVSSVAGDGTCDVVEVGKLSLIESCGCCAFNCVEDEVDVRCKLAVSGMVVPGAGGGELMQVGEGIAI